MPLAVHRPVPDPPGVPPDQRRGGSAGRGPLGRAAGATVLAVGLACVDTRDAGALPAGTPAPALDVQPRTILVVVGHTAQFLSVLPAGGRILWSVVPAGAGSVDAQGVFTPSGSLGDCTVLGTWSLDGRVKGSAQVTIVAAGQPITRTPGLTEAAGGEQSGGGGAVINHLILGEGLAAATGAAVAGGVTLQVRHGFFPDPAADGP